MRATAAGTPATAGLRRADGLAQSSRGAAAGAGRHRDGCMSSVWKPVTAQLQAGRLGFGPQGCLPPVSQEGKGGPGAGAGGALRTAPGRQAGRSQQVSGGPMRP